MGGNTVGSTTLAFATGIAKSSLGQEDRFGEDLVLAEEVLQAFRPIDGLGDALGNFGIFPSALVRTEASASAQAGTTVAGTVGIASAGQGGAVITGLDVDYSVSRAYGGTGYFAPGEAISGHIAVATAQQGAAMARTNSRAYGDVAAAVSGMVNVATGTSFATTQGSEC
jgi:hypothetical protein